jgi:hypothetical protein
MVLIGKRQSVVPSLLEQPRSTGVSEDDLRRTEGMGLNKGARKLRHAAEREATGKNRDAAQRESDTKAAEAHSEVAKPEHRKGRPGPRKQG